MRRVVKGPGGGLVLGRGGAPLVLAVPGGEFTGEFTDEFQTGTGPVVLPVLSLPATATVTEGATATVTVAKAGTGACSATIRTEPLSGAVAGTDYTAIPDTVVAFAAGEQSKAVTLSAAADAVADAGETFRLVLAAPVGCTLGNAACDVTVAEPPLPVLSVPPAAYVEEGSAVVVAITKSGAGACSATVRTVEATATAGADYVGVGPTVVSFASGDTVKTVSIQTAADAAEEGDETFGVTLSDPTGCTLGNAACTVTVTPRPDVPVLPVLSLPATASVNEGAAVGITITKSGAGACSVRWRTLGVTAGGGVDYTPTTVEGYVLDFADAETSKTVTVQTTADTVSEPNNETFNVLLIAGSESGCTLGNATCAVTVVETVPDPVGGTLLFSTTLENADTVPTWDGQELSIGQSFKPGDVPAGNAVRCLVDGAAIPTQVSNRVFWKDGSLKWAQVRMLAPSVPVGGAKTLTWQRYAGTWDSHDAPRHSSPSAITSRVALEWRFTSYRERSSANVAGAELGPVGFHSADMLGSGNSQWIDTVMAGPVCSEWRATDMGKRNDGTRDGHLGAFLYARAWGGTPGAPRRIEFLYRSIYGWSTDIPAAQRGIRCSMDLRVNGTVVRGASLATPSAGWKDRDSYVGGFYGSPGPTGKMDWFDTATNQFVTPPKLVYRINVTYGIASKFIPPYDLDNPLYAAKAAMSYIPQTQASMRQQMSGTAAYEGMSWTNNDLFVQALIPHGRGVATGSTAAKRPLSEIIDHAQNKRVFAWALAAIGAVGYNRTTRKLICQLPPAMNPDPAGLGESVFSANRPSFPTGVNRLPSSGGYNPYIYDQDVAHYPQQTWWTTMTEGDQHMLDLCYAEAVVCGILANTYVANYGGVPGTTPTNIPIGGILYRAIEQTRSYGHSTRPVLVAMAVGKPDDPNAKLVNAMWRHMTQAWTVVIRNDDYWPNTSMPPDGRYAEQIGKFPTLQNQEYKGWMHDFFFAAVTYGAAITEDADAVERAHWSARVPVILGGGWHNDTDYLKKPDHAMAAAYYHGVSNEGVSTAGSTTHDRRPWAHVGQWGATRPIAVTWKADGWTVDRGSAAVNGLICTVVGTPTTTGFLRTTTTATIPAGLTRGIPYYSVQASGSTFKLSARLNGPPVAFTTTGGADMAGHLQVNKCFGAPGHDPEPVTWVSTAGNHYYVQRLCALDFYQHYLVPADARVRLARSKMRALKTERGGDYALMGKTTVPP